MGLVGTVLNATDGTLEIMAEGQKTELEKLKALCQNGPEFAKIEKIEEDWQEIEHGKFSDFNIIYK